jgi:hypothetical protein
MMFPERLMMQGEAGPPGPPRRGNLIGFLDAFKAGPAAAISGLTGEEQFA